MNVLPTKIEIRPCAHLPGKWNWALYRKVAWTKANAWEILTSGNTPRDSRAEAIQDAKEFVVAARKAVLVTLPAPRVKIVKTKAK